MPETVNGSTDLVNRETAGEPAESQREGRDDTGKLVVVMNAALVGVPSAYAVSNSLAVTAVAAVLAVVMVIALAVRVR
ncbi:hypothetical protein O7600_17440 [Micromonospora sp. WMMA1998]|uniref:hypothetical protein n=1 Tax=Micromonospora sp. WMMA1998 TaxID=3015167 RepID=UPI00248A9B82|nr:hypothetical protein [Micromonospora sp. WMMA1998]WBC12958.1 hypothetical protein O7600_17440 [Micromonospora sp. WMMA1998]